MPIGTATHRLRKNLLFRLVKQLGMDGCYQCGRPIETVEDLSIEHKKPWQSAPDPVDVFFDLDNIAFSHISCNIAAGVKTNKRFESRVEQDRAKSARRNADPKRREAWNSWRRERYASGQNPRRAAR
jgi:hypothetical protein